MSKPLFDDIFNLARDGKRIATGTKDEMTTRAADMIAFRDEQVTEKYGNDRQQTIITRKSLTVCHTYQITKAG